MDLLTQTSLIVAVVALALGGSSFAKNPRSKLVIGYAGVCGIVFLWAIGFCLSRAPSAAGFYRLHLLANIWVAPVALRFVHALTGVRDRLSRLLFLLSLALSVVLTPLPWLGADQWGMGFALAMRLAPITLAVQLLYLMVAQLRARAESPSLIYLGALIVLTTSWVDHFPRFGETIPAIANLGLAIYLFFLGQAVKQQKFMNLSAIVARFLMILSVALLLSGMYLLLYPWIKDSAALVFLNSFFVSILVVMLVDPLREWIASIVLRPVTRTQRRLGRLIERARRDLQRAKDLPDVIKPLLDILVRLTGADRMTAYVLSGDGTVLRRVAGRGPSDSTQVSEEPRLSSIEISLEDPLIERVLTLKKRGMPPLIFDQSLQNESERSASRSEREKLLSALDSLHRIGVQLAIPLFQGDRVLGLIALQVGDPPEEWGANWGILQSVIPLFQEAGDALKGLEILGREREKERLASLGQMAAGLAHEIRNPLSAIKASAQFLDTTSEHPESRFLGIIVEEVDRLDRVVSQFLDYSKPQGSNSDDIHFVELVESTVQRWSSAIASDPPAGLPIKIDFVKPAEPIWVRGSAFKLVQVLRNLLQNSLRATEFNAQDRRVKVSLETVKSRRNRSDVVLTVQDNGNGISGENIEKIFIPFFTTFTRGTGLGLSICQKIVRDHSGSIEVESQTGAGAKFRVILPQTEARA